jgi:hypothetical protein
VERELEEVERFAAEWHSGRWLLSSLPDALQLRVVTFPDGGEVLGVSLLPLNGVGLSARLEHSPLRLAIQTHECVHHLLKISSAALCQMSWYPIRDELLAWIGAGRLTVSTQQIGELEAGRLTAADLAEECGVPAPLIELGAAAHARQRGDHAGLTFALAAWCLEMQRLVGLL